MQVRRGQALDCRVRQGSGLVLMQVQGAGQGPTRGRERIRLQMLATHRLVPDIQLFTSF